MTEPYHPFRKRAPSGDDSQDNLCAECGKSPMDGVHNPTIENYLPWECASCGRRLGPYFTVAYYGDVDQVTCVGCPRPKGAHPDTGATIKTVPTQDEPAEGKPPQPPQRA